MVRHASAPALPAAARLLNCRQPVEQFERKPLAEPAAADFQRNREHPLDLDQDRDPGRERLDAPDLEAVLTRDLLGRQLPQQAQRLA